MRENGQARNLHISRGEKPEEKRPGTKSTQGTKSTHFARFRRVAIGIDLEISFLDDSLRTAKARSRRKTDGCRRVSAWELDPAMMHGTREVMNSGNRRARLGGLARRRKGHLVAVPTLAAGLGRIRFK